MISNADSDPSRSKASVWIHADPKTGPIHNTGISCFESWIFLFGRLRHLLELTRPSWSHCGLRVIFLPSSGSGSEIQEPVFET
jgi:hypothetical protein